MSDFRRRILEPLLLPLSAFVFVGGIAWGLSRILLATTKEGSAVVAMAAALGVLGACAAIASHGFRRPEKWAAATAFVALVAGGSVFAATIGIRPFEGHLPPPSAVIVAKSAARFEQPTLHIDAPKPELVVEFDNQDTAQPHNWTLAQSKAQADKIIVPGGGFFTGPAKREYLLKDVPAGTYYYYCAVHPGPMNGTLTIGNVAAPPAPTPEHSMEESPAPAPSGSLAAGTGPGSATLIARTSADGIPSFDVTTFTLASGKAVTITLDNKDSGIPHNVAIYADAGFTKHLFHGDFVTGPKAQEYAVPPQPAGHFFFRCDVHPAQMKGTVVFA